MTKRTTSILHAGRCHRWRVALVVAVLAGSCPAAPGQSVLRFVEPGSEAADAVGALPAPISSAAPAPNTNASEFRFLEVTESKTPPLPQFTISKPRETSQPQPPHESSSLTFAPQDKPGRSEAKLSASELRFVNPPQQVRPQTVVITPVTPERDFADVAPNSVETGSPVVAKSKRLPKATELFASPPLTRPSAFKPRIARVLEHVPAPVPQHIEAQSVRSTRDAAPTYTPPGSELFVAGAPKKWDVPALDYGSALRQVKPPQMAIVTPKAVEPTRVVARELSPSATEMFTFAAAEPLVIRQPVVMEPAKPVVAAQEPVVAKATTAAPTFASTSIATAPREEVIPRRVTPPALPTPVATPASKPLFVSTPPKLPAASELKMSHVAAAPAPAPVLAKPVEPTRVVARDLSPAATGMFTLAPAQTLVIPPQTVAPAVQHPIQQPILAKAPVAAAPKVSTPMATKPAFAAARAPQPVAVAKIEPAAPKLTTPAPAPAAPVSEKQFVNAPPKLPAAANLDFSHVPAYAEPAKPQFLAAAPTYVASATPIVPPAAPERLVPATISEPAVSKLPFAYETGKLASEPPVVPARPASIAAPVAVAPERSQVAVTAEPNDPNVYTFRFAASTNETPAQLVNNMQPTPANVSPGPEAIEPATIGPETMSAPCGCNGGCYGPYGCPYLPGQSGTRALCGVDCGRNGAPCCSTWSDAQCIPWSLFGPGEYVGPARPAHVETYYLRVNDNITLTFIASRKKSAEHYRIGVGDELQIEWLQGAGNTETPLDRKLLVQPDGTVTLPLIGEVVAAGKTVNEFREESVKLYSKYQRDPQITVTPLTVNVAVQDVLKAVTAKNASSGQTQDLRVTPEGTIQAAGIGSVYVQGLTLDELRSELEGRYAEAYGPGLAVSPQLTERATSYVFLGGEVKLPGRYTLEGPTTAMQAIALAGGWNNGGNLKQVVIFRRDENWCLKATKIDVRAPYYGKDPCPTNDVWLRDNDLVIVPKSCVLCATDLIELYFTRGVYAVFPINYVYDFSASSGIVPVP